MLLSLLLVAVVVALLPTIVANTSLRDVLVSAMMPSDRLRVSIGEASLGWLTPPALRAVEVKDARGTTLLTVESASIDRPLWSLLVSPREAAIEIVRPALHVELRARGSNLEDIVGGLLPPSSADVVPSAGDQPAASGTPISVRIVEGSVLVNDPIAMRRWRVQNVDVEFVSSPANDGLDRFAMSGQLDDLATHEAGAVEQQGSGRPAGQFSVSLATGEGNRRQLSWRAESLSIAFLRPWLHRYIDDAEIKGALVGGGTAAWTASATSALPADFTSSGLMQLEQLEVAASALAGDRLRLGRVELPWRLASQPIGLVLEDLRLVSDLGQVAVRGVIDGRSVRSSWGMNATALDAAARHDVELRGAVDLAKLAAMLPRALRVRENTTITSGAVEFSIRQEPTEGGQTLRGTLRTANLAARRAGRMVRWEEPISARFSLQRENGSMRLNGLTCQSEFLNINASGTPQQFAASATFDLNRFANQLGQFVDLRGVELAGTGSAELKWSGADAGRFAADATGELARLRVALPGEKVWAEPQLEITAAASGTIDTATRRPANIESGRIALLAQGDELDARLTAPVDRSSATPTWPVSVTAKGSVERWLTRVRPWVHVDPWQISGEGELVANVRLGGTSVETRGSRLTVADLRAEAPGWNIHEPRVELAGDVNWDGSTGQLAVENAQFVTSTVSVAVRDVRYRPPQRIEGQQSIGQLHGVAAFRTDLARLAAWQAPSDEPTQYRAAGAITGNVRFEQHAEGIRGEVTALGQNLSLAQRGPNRGRRNGHGGEQTIWQEPSIRLRGLAGYDAASDRLSLSECVIQSNTLQANVVGNVEHVLTTADVNVSGTVDYDLAHITPLLRPYLGEGIQLQGREQGRFAVTGSLGGRSGEREALSSNTADDPYRVVSSGEFSPGDSLIGNREVVHWSRRLRGQLEMPWSGASVYGMPVGGGKIAAVLSDGAIRVEPISVTVGQGRLTAAPAVRLDPPPAEVTMPPGPLITNVRISPEVSEAMLKYVAPVLAGATESEGLFSMQLDGVRMPLGEVDEADAAGRLTVHSVRVVPGPLANQWIGLAHQIEALAKRRDPASLAGRSPITLLSIRDQAVNFRVADGRVHHEPMEFSVDEVVLRSQGSVGFDETLSLLLQVPIQDRWVERERLLVGLKGQTLSIPISGTLTRPQMDQRAVGSLSQQLLESAAQQAIGDELNKALEKLFKKK